MVWVLLALLIISSLYSIHLKLSGVCEGDIVIKRMEGKRVFSLEIDKDPNEIASMKKICFKVIDEESQDIHPL